LNLLSLVILNTMSLYLYNTLTRQLEEFKPLKNGRVGIYTCGPTVYNYAHIGNLRTYIFEDVLKRVLMYNGYKINHAMNITDVGHLTSDGDTGEDKMEKGAKREGKSAWEIAEFYTNAFKKDLEELNILPPNVLPKATDHIKEQIKLIKKLEKKGFTYQSADGIYFDTSKLADYGKLAELHKQELRAGARIDVGDKKNITDFALWKFSYFSPPAGGGGKRGREKKRQMEWGSSWGVGFPGWHIECSAMAAKYLGQPFDIHCGGIDHIPVHHTNEIAQSEAANEKPLANYWMHGEFLVIPGGDKMAKSGENFLTLETVKKHHLSPLAYRYFVLQTHYRKQLTFSWEALQAAQNGLEHLYNILRGWWEPKVGCAEYEEKFFALVNNDLDMPGALALMWELLRDEKFPASARKRTVLKFDNVFGLGLAEHGEEVAETLPKRVQKIVTERDEARRIKDWQKSDELRAKLEDMGYVVKDMKEGTKVKKTRRP